jgi:hypothetical protein
VEYPRTFVSTKTGSAAIVAVQVFASERDAAVPRHVVNRQVGDAGPLFSVPWPGDGNCGLVLAGGYRGGRDARNTMIATDPKCGR